MLVILLFLIFCTAAMTGYVLLPTLYDSLSLLGDKRLNRYSGNIDQLMPRQKARRVSRLLTLTPLIFAAIFWFISPPGVKIVGIIMGLVLGFIFPGFYVQHVTRKRQNMFNDQLIDSLMIMSSSFRGGLSLVQALEAVVEEMPDPINKEFGTVLGENKMGASLEEALQHLYNRMPSPAVQQMITAILLARETGGNLPAIFNRIVTNIRETRKIQQNLDTLTVQGKIQGVVMALLPIGFGYIVYTANRAIFEHMFTSNIGRALLIYAFFSELIGGFLIWKISTFKDF